MKRQTKTVKGKAEHATQSDDIQVFLAVKASRQVFGVRGDKRNVCFKREIITAVFPGGIM